MKAVELLLDLGLDGRRFKFGLGAHGSGCELDEVVWTEVPVSGWCGSAEELKPFQQAPSSVAFDK
jgi:hypothetical protein